MKVRTRKRRRQGEQEFRSVTVPSPCACDHLPQPHPLCDQADLNTHSMYIMLANLRSKLTSLDANCSLPMQHVVHTFFDVLQASSPKKCRFRVCQKAIIGAGHRLCAVLHGRRQTDSVLSLPGEHHHPARRRIAFSWRGPLSVASGVEVVTFRGVVLLSCSTSFASGTH